MPRLLPLCPLFTGLKPKGTGALQVITPQLDCSAFPSRGLAALPHPETGVWHKKCDEVSLGDWGRKRKAVARKASRLGKSRAGQYA